MMGGQNLNGKTVLVTGGAKRLGAALALALAEQGACVVVHYNRGGEAAKELARQITQAGGRAFALQADLLQVDAVAALVPGAIEQAGPLDILINNASIFNDITFAETTPDAIEKNMAVNAVAPMVLSRAFAAQRRPGAIINMVDTMVMDYDNKHVPYHLSKRALHALTHIMALEFAPDIRVNAVAPGLILPPEGKDESYLAGLAHSNPLNRYGSADDIVDAALYLLGAEFVTGQTLYVDGGRHLRGRMYE